MALIECNLLEASVYHGCHDPVGGHEGVRFARAGLSVRHECAIEPVHSRVHERSTDHATNLVKDTTEEFR